MKNDWTYGELTLLTEDNIKRNIRWSEAAHATGNIRDGKISRERAFGAYHLWYAITRGLGGLQEKDALRLAALIPIDLADYEDPVEVIGGILEIISKDELWSSETQTCFNRGRITGMCHRVGVGIRADE